MEKNTYCNSNKDIKSLKKYRSKFFEIYKDKESRVKTLPIDLSNNEIVSSETNLFLLSKIINIFIQLGFEQDYIYNLNNKNHTNLEQYTNICFDYINIDTYNIKIKENNNEFNIFSNKCEEFINIWNKFKNEYENIEQIILRILYNNKIEENTYEILLLNMLDKKIIDKLMKYKNAKQNEHCENSPKLKNDIIHNINKIKTRIKNFRFDIIQNIRHKYKITNNNIIYNHNKKKRNLSENKYDILENNTYNKQITDIKCLDDMLTRFEYENEITNIINANRDCFIYKKINNDNINIISNIKYYVKTKIYNNEYNIKMTNINSNDNLITDPLILEYNKNLKNKLKKYYNMAIKPPPSQIINDNTNPRVHYLSVDHNLKLDITNKS